MTPKGQMAFGGGPPITHLPPAMKAMFQPGPPLIFREKIVKRRPTPYTGVAQYLELFEATAPPERETHETPRERRAKVKAEKAAQHAADLKEAVEAWDPQKPPAEVADLTTGDAYKTLFVARLSEDTTEAKLKREFEQFGPIKSLRVVHERAPGGGGGGGGGAMDDDDDDAGAPRGYAFVEYEHEADMRDAYKRADGRKIDGKRVLVDVERGRTVRNWRPRRLGGGLGNTRSGKPGANGAPRPGGGGGGAFQPSRVVSQTYRPPSNPPPPQAARARDDDRDRSRRDRSRSRDRDRDRTRRDDYRDRDRDYHRRY